MTEAKTGVRSGKVRTVLGPIPVEAMGVTLMHEHILLDTSSWWKRPCCASDIAFAERPLDISMIGELRMNPFLNRDNCGLMDMKAAILQQNAMTHQQLAEQANATQAGNSAATTNANAANQLDARNKTFATGIQFAPSWSH